MEEGVYQSQAQIVAAKWSPVQNQMVVGLSDGCVEFYEPEHQELVRED